MRAVNLQVMLTLWFSGNLEQNTEFGTSGFNGLPASYRGSDNGGYYGMGYGGSFWSSTENDSGSAWYRTLYYDYSEVYRTNYSKQGGFSVRCLRD